MGEDWTHRHATELRDHWWWRPGWSAGTRWYTWHLTFEDQPRFHDLVARHQQALAGHRGVDLVPRRWLHLTMQGQGDATTVPDDHRAAVAGAVRGRLARLAPPTVTFGRPVVRPEAIALPALPPAEVVAIRDAVRAGIAEVTGAEDVPENATGFQPHVTIAYSNRVQPAGPIVELIDAVEVEPIEILLDAVQLIELHRDHRMYEWRAVEEVRLGTL